MEEKLRAKIGFPADASNGAFERWRRIRLPGMEPCSKAEIDVVLNQIEHKKTMTL